MWVRGNSGPCPRVERARREHRLSSEPTSLVTRFFLQGGTTVFVRWRSSWKGRLPLIGVGLLLIGVASWAVPEPSRSGGPGAARVFEPAAPILPAEIIAALQDHRYPEAIKGLDALSAQPNVKPGERAYYGLIGGIARRLNGALDPARTTLEAALKADPKGPWGVKLRSELTAVEMAAGRFAAAETLARAESESLLDNRAQGSPRQRLPDIRRQASQAERSGRAGRSRRRPRACWSRAVRWPRARRSAPACCWRWLAPARPRATTAAPSVSSNHI